MPSGNLTQNKTLAPVITGALAAVALVGALAAPACAQDDAKKDTIVYSENGTEKRRTGVVIESADYSEVKFKASGRSSTISGADVVDILWGDATNDIARGRRALSNQNGSEAIDAYQTAIAAKAAGVIEREWIVEWGNAGLGQGHMLAAGSDDSQVAKAVKAFEKALAANPKSLLSDKILGGLAEAALAEDNGAAARGHADALVKAGRDGRRPLWEVQGHFLRARAAIAGDNSATASQAYDEAARVAESAASSERDGRKRATLESLRRTAAASAGWVLVDSALASKSSADFDKARTYFEGLASKFGKEPEILAASENAMGVIKYANGDTHGALHHFQTVEVLYFSVRAEVPRSLYYQALCWEKLNDAEQKAGRVQDLKEYYPQSEWARKL